MAKRKAIHGVTHNAGKYQGTRQEVRPPPLPPFRTGHLNQHHRGRDAAEGHNRAGGGVIAAESEDASRVRDGISTQVPWHEHSGLDCPVGCPRLGRLIGQNTHQDDGDHDLK
jgi:hypothetical protein